MSYGEVGVWVPGNARSKGRCWEVTFTFAERQVVHLVRTYANQSDMVRDTERKVGSDPVMRNWIQEKEYDLHSSRRGPPAAINRTKHQQCELLDPDKKRGRRRRQGSAYAAVTSWCWEDHEFKVSLSYKAKLCLYRTVSSFLIFSEKSRKGLQNSASFLCILPNLGGGS